MVRVTAKELHFIAGFLVENNQGNGEDAGVHYRAFSL
ncbi:hypothetical protein GGE07_004688 [Sinorhizobium terangae]|nr:hypothetical protein [Sinorhizobium terangae]